MAVIWKVYRFFYRFLIRAIFISIMSYKYLVFSGVLLSWAAALTYCYKMLLARVLCKSDLPVLACWLVRYGKLRKITEKLRKSYGKVLTLRWISRYNANYVTLGVYYLAEGKL